MKPGRGDWVQDVSAGLLVELIEPSREHMDGDWPREQTAFWLGTTVTGDLVEVQLIRYSGDSWVTYFVTGDRAPALAAQNDLLFGEVA